MQYIEVITTFVTIVGSLIVGFLLYHIRQDRKRNRLRRAIATEMQANRIFLDRAIEEEGTPVNEFLKTSVIDSNADRLGYFSDREVKYIVGYLNCAKRMNEAVALNRTPECEFTEKPDNLKNIVQGEAQKAQEHHENLLDIWEPRFSEGYESLEEWNSEGCSAVKS